MTRRPSFQRVPYFDEYVTDALLGIGVDPDYVFDDQRVFEEQNKVTASMAKVQRYPNLCEKMSKCRFDKCAAKRCRAACAVGRSKFAAKLQIEANEIFASSSLKLYAVTLLYPQDVVQLSKLPKFKVNGLKRRIQRGLTSLREQGYTVFAFGGIEASLEAELSPIQWHVHSHLVLATDCDKKTLKSLLRPKRKAKTKNFRPIVIKRVDKLANYLSYSTKQKSVKRFTKIKKQPVDAKSQTFFYRWLMKLDVDELVFLYGLRRGRGKLTLLRSS